MTESPARWRHYRKGSLVEFVSAGVTKYVYCICRSAYTTGSPVFVNVYMYVHIYIYKRICVCVCVCIYTRICIYAYKHIYTCIYIYICVYIYIYMYIYICMNNVTADGT